MDPNVIRLWEGDAPGALGKADQDIPTLTVFQPAKPNGSAIVVCPGGGYGMLADHEGSGYARYLKTLGITAFVLKYRLGSHGYRHPVMLQDAQRAIRWVRSHTSAYGIQASKIGIMGSSAGGHLASTALVHFGLDLPTVGDDVDRESSRPDFGILCYPVIDLGEFAHVGSRENLIGKTPDSGLAELLSNQKQVKKTTPPTFLWSTADDSVVPVQNSLLFAAACAKHQVPVELHVYPTGPHGLGLGESASGFHPWVAEFARWLRESGLTP